ncbi:MAG TPA: hypothetical protein VK509_21970 [Polyangiales bacterium]|nr:hypothetical protein [Polyangiales bacterium]
MTKCSGQLFCAVASACVLSIAARAAAAEPPPPPYASSVPASAGPSDSAEPIPEEESDAPSPERFRIGVLGGVGFPRPLAVEAMVKIERLIGLGIEYSVLPTLTISDVRTSFYAVAADVRVFPLRSGLFIGMRAGYQHLGGETTVMVQDFGSFPVSAQVETVFINPRIGFLWTWEPGITVGIDAGLQIPVGSEVSRDIPAFAEGSEPDQELMRIARNIGQATLPTLDLLRVGFLL